MKGWLVVFAKAPEAGRVKTRLSPPLSPRQAATLYECLLKDALDETAVVARELSLDAIVTVAPAEASREIAAKAPVPFRAIGQPSGDLGARMSHVVRQAAAAGAPFAMLRGSDAPCLDRDRLRAAVEALAAHDLVVSPDADGGYGLVGVGRRVLGDGSVGELFDHPMSTPTVLSDTLARARRLGLEIGMLPPGFDVDRYADLQRLAQERQQNASLRCWRTLAFLDESGLWP